MKRKANEQKIKNIEKVLNAAKEQGALMTIITRENSIGGCWGWILTKNKNLLYVQNDYFGGVSFSLQYTPSRENGSGCGAGEERQDPNNINIDAIEKSGLNFAHRLGAKLLTSEQINKKIEKILSDENNENY